ncbi:MAG TPA: S-layer homology domain-containing protein [Chloroflexia bacterium]
MKLKLLTTSLSTMVGLLVGAALMGGVAFAGAPISQGAGAPAGKGTQGHAPKAPQPGVPQECVDNGFNVVEAPAQGLQSEFLGLDAISASDVWGVGMSQVSQSTPGKQLAMHWNGTQWSVTTNPDPFPTSTLYLQDVEAVASNNVWAVGNGVGLGKAFIQHWDGTQWSLATIPGAATSGTLYGLTAVSANDIWAVGENAQLDALFVHYDGTSWSVIPGPAIANSGELLYEVSALSANDIWAVGEAVVTNITPIVRKTLTMHWNGSAWSVVASPNPYGATVDHYLQGVSMSAANDVWAVGYSENQSIILHWNGTAWANVPAPVPANSSNQILYDVSVRAANDVWAVGSAVNTTQGGYRPLAMRWNGSAWALVPAANNSANGTAFGFNAVSPLSANDVWAGGAQTVAFRGQILSERFTNSLCPTQTPTITPTYTAVPPSNTPVPPTNTSTALPATATRTNTVAPPTATNTTGPPTSTATPPTCVPFEVVASPGIGTFLDMAAVSANDIWAVGYGAGTGRGTYVAHWDGSVWSHVPSPSPQFPNLAELHDVTVVSATDIWAVGYNLDDGEPRRYHTLIEHWNGSTWSIVSDPGSTGTTNTYLLGADAASANDVWAVGNRNGVPNFQTYIERWNGSQWNVVPGPAFGSDVHSFLTDVDAISATDAYAVGYTVNTTTNQTHNLVIRWNGSAWSIVPTPNLGSTPTQLNSISVLAANDIWAVGFSGSIFGAAQTLTMHWNGSAWSIVPSPNLGAGTDLLERVAAASANDVWAVGSHREPTSPFRTRTIAMRWNGSAWSIVPTANPSAESNILYGVVALSANNVWAVGSQASSSTPDLIEHYTGPCAGATPSATAAPPTSTNTAVPPTATNTPVQPSATSTSVLPTIPVTVTATIPPVLTSTPSAIASSTTIPTNTALPVMTNTPGSTSTPVASTSTVTVAPTSIVGTPTTGMATSTPAVATATASAATATAIPPTACSMQFSDVPEGSTFYPYVRCLVCRGIVSGYSDGTFRPNNNVTRGQIAKMVSNAAGFADDPGGQIYDDVPPGSTFYAPVNRLSHRGIVSGYPCPDPGETCMPTNASFFRPEANATRGQLSKIVSNSAGFNEGINSRTFEDVTSGSPFYVWIERLATRSIMGGYACGGAGEPCVEGNRPYFRPAVEITRGQTAKIVANTFFPACQTMSGR